MALPRYLAQTSEEFAACSAPPARMAWMACHFSPYGTGLVNLPPTLPPGAMIILNDRIPMAGHDPDAVIRQLRGLEPNCLLLDFQRSPTAESLEMTRRIIGAFSRLSGVSAPFGQDLNCPLFLPAPHPDTPLSDYLKPWKGREIWLEIGYDSKTYTITEAGGVSAPLSAVPADGFAEPELCCHYRMTPAENQVVFDLWRTREDLEALLKKATAFGVTKAVGLWQELGGKEK